MTFRTDDISIIFMTNTVTKQELRNLEAAYLDAMTGGVAEIIEKAKRALVTAQLRRMGVVR